MSRDTRRSSGWMLLELLQDGAVSVLFEAGNSRTFSQLRRRSSFNSAGVTDAVLKAATATKRSGLPCDGRTALPDGSEVRYAVRPVFGPLDEVYGCQVWLGAVDEEILPARNVEAFSFDMATNLTHHGPGVDLNILSVDSLASSRPSHDNIFSFYDNFPRQPDLGLYIESIREGAPRREFQADISLTDGRGIGRNIHASMINVHHHDDGRTELRGVLHEITDIRPHTTNYALSVAKRFAVQSDPGVGRALIDLTTGIALDWINPPTGSLLPWNREIPQFTVRGQQASMNLRNRVLQDSSLYVEFQTQVKFDSTGDRWIDIIIGYEHHGDNQGLMTVRDATTVLAQSFSTTS
ncbi:GAF domain-containing protein [Rhodococcoides fascians]|uniref:GAF domain-containing protein n=1 Tax=Rhodococcoides fascians TaxID=1828 RepID=UPI0012D2CB64|nr:GAF domain-containing protein [Rhodococcus fascians]